MTPPSGGQLDGFFSHHLIEKCAIETTKEDIKENQDNMHNNKQLSKQKYHLIHQPTQLETSILYQQQLNKELEQSHI